MKSGASPVIPPNQLLHAYSLGVFPMADGCGGIDWFSPLKRGILPLDREIRLPHGIRRDLRRRPWEIRVDADFRGTMEACANRKETWIDDGIVDSYCALHKLGRAHSVEAWLDGKFAGGLYGVHLGAAFFGESMVSIVPGASKAALVALMAGLRAADFLLLDTQWLTPHLALFGGIEISREDYLFRLEAALAREAKFPEFFPLHKSSRPPSADATVRDSS